MPDPRNAPPGGWEPGAFPSRRRPSRHHDLRQCEPTLNLDAVVALLLAASCHDWQWHRSQSCVQVADWGSGPRGGCARSTSRRMCDWVAQLSPRCYLPGHGGRLRVLLLAGVHRRRPTMRPMRASGTQYGGIVHRPEPHYCHCLCTRVLSNSADGTIVRRVRASAAGSGSRSCPGAKHRGRRRASERMETVCTVCGIDVSATGRNIRGVASDHMPRLPGEGLPEHPRGGRFACLDTIPSHRDSRSEGG